MTFSGTGSGSHSGAQQQRYEILGKLASGGMGTVHLARMRGPLGFRRLVAIKSMHPKHASDPAACAMFLDEAQLTAQLRHPNIVPTLDFVAEGGEYMLVMDYIEGDSLRALQKASIVGGDRASCEVACAIARDVLLGLHAAHEARDDEGRPLGIIHRDVSPDNVIVGVDGIARVLDFGVAQARMPAYADYGGEVRGKLVYMAPEQLLATGGGDGGGGDDTTNQPVDRTADVYSVGALLWEALTGRRLFRGATDAALVQLIIRQRELQPPSAAASGLGHTIPRALDDVILRMLSRDPRDRPRTALGAARELEAALPSIAAAHEVARWVKRFARPRPVERRTTTTTTSSFPPSSSRHHQHHHQRPRYNPYEPIVRPEGEVSTMPGVARTIERTESGSIVTHRRHPRGAQNSTPIYVFAGLIAIAALSAVGLGMRAAQQGHIPTASAAAAAPAAPQSRCAGATALAR